MSGPVASGPPATGSSSGSSTPSLTRGAARPAPTQERRRSRRADRQPGPVGQRVDQHGLPVADLAAQQRPGQVVTDRRLHQPTQRSRTVQRVEPGHGQPLAGGIGDVESQPPGGQSGAERGQLDVDDPHQVLDRQRVEDHHVVEPVQELGLEVPAHRAHDRLPLRRLGQLTHQRRRAEVRGQHEQGVAEVDRATLAVGQAAVVEHGQQDVEDIGVGLLDLVQQHDRVRTPAHRLGQLATLVVADVAGRGTDQASHRVLLGVFAHVDAHHRALVVEEEVGQRLGQLGLAHAGRAEEQERAGRPVRVRDPSPSTTDRVRHRLHGLLLSDHPGAELVLHAQQLGCLALEQPAGLDPGPGRHDVGDVVGRDLVLEQVGPGRPLAAWPRPRWRWPAHARGPGARRTAVVTRSRGRRRAGPARSGR